MHHLIPKGLGGRQVSCHKGFAPVLVQIQTPSTTRLNKRPFWKSAYDNLRNKRVSQTTFNAIVFCTKSYRNCRSWCCGNFGVFAGRTSNDVVKSSSLMSAKFSLSINKQFVVKDNLLSPLNTFSPANKTAILKQRWKRFSRREIDEFVWTLPTIFTRNNWKLGRLLAVFSQEIRQLSQNVSLCMFVSASVRHLGFVFVVFLQHELSNDSSSIILGVHSVEWMIYSRNACETTECCWPEVLESVWKAGHTQRDALLLLFVHTFLKSPSKQVFGVTTGTEKHRSKTCHVMWIRKAQTFRTMNQLQPASLLSIFLSTMLSLNWGPDHMAWTSRSWSTGVLWIGQLRVWTKGGYVAERQEESFSSPLFGANWNTYAIQSSSK